MALLGYIDECEWRRLEYGEQQAKALGIDADEVVPLVEEYRAEAGTSEVHVIVDTN